MLGFVTQEKYDAEHELRIKAEAREEALREQVSTLTDLLREERVRQSDLLDRFQPKQESNGHSMLDADTKHMTADQIMAIPAYGKGDMRRRLQMAAMARKREEEEASRQKVESQNGKLTEDEARLIDRITI